MKIRIVFFGFALVAAVPVAATAQNAKTLPASVTLPECLVSVTAEGDIPAQEAGVLRELLAKEGDQVKAGDLLAQIDDVLAKMQLEVAEYELEVSEAQANNQTHLEYANWASEVAKAEWQAAVEANNKHRDTFPEIEVRKLLLTYYRTTSEIKQAKVDLAIAGLEAKVSTAKVAAAAEGIKRHQIKCPPETIPEGESPPEGVVTELFRHAGEWVERGEPVMHIVRMDRLWIQDTLKASEYWRGDIEGRPVTVHVALARGRRETFKGKIVLASPIVEYGGEFKIRAEVQNRRDADGRWILNPGLRAEMTIHLK